MILVAGATGHVGRGHRLQVGVIRPRCSLPLRVENLRAFEISFFEQTPGVRQIA